MPQLGTLRTIDPILTNIARGYSNTDLISETLFPVVGVDKEGGKIPTWGKEAFKIWGTERAIKADSNEMEVPWLTTTSFQLTEHDLAGRVDYREIKETDIVDLEANAVNMVMQAIELRREKLAAELAFTAANYSTDNKTSFSDDYLNEDAVDPVKFIDGKNDALRAIIGKYANTLVMGNGVWKALKHHPLIKAYFSTNERQLITLDNFKELVGIENIIIGNSLYTADGDTFSDIWGNAMLLAYVAPASGIARTPYEPCFGYTLRRSGYPYSDKWEEQNGKIRKVRTTDNFDVKLVGAESGYLVTTPIDPAVI